MLKTPLLKAAHIKATLIERYSTRDPNMFLVQKNVYCFYAKSVCSGCSKDTNEEKCFTEIVADGMNKSSAILSPILSLIGYFGDLFGFRMKTDRQYH